MYGVIYNGEIVEEFDTMREAEEYIDYKISHWPQKYNYNNLDIVKI